MAGDDEFDRWISPIEMTLNTLTNKKVRGNSIVDIPEHLKKSNMKAYKPKVVSIGPLHRKSSQEPVREFKKVCPVWTYYRAARRTTKEIQCVAIDYIRYPFRFLPKQF